ncbi:hypothetical protein Y032_0726g1869 [Ancylostoma ceylanicum]|uniref:Uncharacterized protein n=1 Tax=Ancylostoma ceylanicum TaxID=53326 RepID=A0A016WEM7_9BILA|nr:hypothetical protein Y032_0726g1869 [Ancylostoma ceylanicum]
MDEADLAEYNRFCEMRFIYRSMTCSKDKELFKEYCLKAVKKKQAESEKEMGGCSKMHPEDRAPLQVLG